MTKARRQATLLDVIRRRPVRTQGELGRALERRGVRASQVTLSRDLRELGVVKAPEGYREPLAAPPTSSDEALFRVLREFLVEATPAQNLVVLKTKPGGANAVALALDRASWDDIIGTVAGDDTILAATASNAKAKGVAKRLRL